MALFARNLLPASFRGVPFAVLADETAGGRRVALHQYPGRDEPWAEDMGRDARRFRFRGFICTGDVVFAGGPVALQRALLLAALEKGGTGTLTHPTLGILQVNVTRFALGEDLGAGRMSTLDAEFVESGKRNFPSLLTSSTGVFSAANVAKVALAVDGVRAIALARAAGGRRRELSTTAATWTSRTIALGGDATALHRLAAQLPGQHGRFAEGGNSGLAGRTVGQFTSASVIAEVTASASAARVAITAAAGAVATIIAEADLAYAPQLATTAIALVAALAAACADPADAIRLLLLLLAFAPDRAEALTGMGVAFGRMVRRAAVAELVRAVAQYQPISADESAALIARLGASVDLVATDAANAGEDESFRALRAARAAMVDDLRARGATLARVTGFTVPAPMPALTLAQHLYRDAARADQLVAQAAPVHPLFMPTSFQALAA